MAKNDRLKNKCSGTKKKLYSFFLSELKAPFMSQAVGESGAHSATFSKIGSGAHTFNSWCFILSWYIPYNKSFKCPIGVPVASQMVSTLESVMCRCVIWQNLPHIGTGQVLSPAGAHFVSDETYLFITERHPVSMDCFISVCAIHPRQLQYIENGH